MTHDMIVNGAASVQAFMPTKAQNVQESVPTTQVTVATATVAPEGERLLTKRNARWARRASH